MITLLRNTPLPTSLLSYLPQGVSSCLASTGRSAVTHLIKKLKLTTRDSVLLPAYVPEGIIEPFKQLGIQIKFYRVNPDLTPDLEYFERALKEKSIKISVLIHPFGFESPVQIFCSLARKVGVWVLEDCAHGLFSRYHSGDKFGTEGDFALFSFNKFLPVTDGAWLISHIKKIDLDSKERFSRPHEKPIKHYLDHLRINACLSRSVSPIESRSLLEKSCYQYNQYYKYINQNLRFLRPTQATKKSIKQVDVSSIVRARVQNTEYFYKHLLNPRFKFVYKKYTSNIVCFAVPLLVQGLNRDFVINKLFNHGVLLSTLVDRWNFIPAGEEKFFKAEACFLKNHVLVPISEFLTLEQMSLLAEEMNRL